MQTLLLLIVSVWLYTVGMDQVTQFTIIFGAFSMAPGQGFWVAAANTTDTALNFTAAMRTTTGTGDFVTGPQLLTYEIGLNLYNGEIEKAKIKFYFKDGLTLRS